MVATNKLRGLMAEKGLSQRRLAEMLGMSEKTLCTKLKRGVFGTDDAQKLIKILEIENPNDIFFAEKVT